MEESSRRSRLGFLQAVKEISAIIRYTLLLMIVWIAIVCMSLIWNQHQQKERNINFALAEAKSAYVKDMIYRPTYLFL